MRGGIRYLQHQLLESLYIYHYKLAPLVGPDPSQAHGVVALSERLTIMCPTRGYIQSVCVHDLCPITFELSSPTDSTRARV
jgi:hypothetical protein